MNVPILAAAAAIAGLFACSPAVAKSPSWPHLSTNPYTDPNSGGGIQPWWSTAPNFGSTPCTEVLASPRSHPSGQVEYCRSVEQPR